MCAAGDVTDYKREKIMVTGKTLTTDKCSFTTYHFMEVKDMPK